MGLPELLLTGLTALCLNSSCPDDNTSYRLSYQRYQLLKDQLKNETLIITTLKNEPLSGYIEANGTLIGTGVAFDVINILQKEYGFKYVLVPPNDGVFEPINGRGGVKNMLLDGKVDVAAAFLPLQYTDVVGYSRILDTAQWVVLMKRPDESATGSGLLAPFTPTVWTLIIISLFVVGPILWLIVILRAKMCKEDNDMVFSLPSCMWFVYGALLKQGSTLNPKTDSSRLLFSTWWLFITILTAFYTANLTAFLTLSKFTLQINEAKDIAEKNYKWVTNRGNGIIEELNKQTLNGDKKSLYEQIGMPAFQVNADETVILSEYVTKKDYMYIREKTILETVMYEDYKRKTKDNVEENKRCTYVITTFPVCVFPRAFAFKPDFKYRDLFDLTIQHLSESGITEFKQREYLPDTTICPLNLGSKERRLRNADLSMTYKIVGGGLIISSIIFAIELIIDYFKRQEVKQSLPVNISSNNNNNFYKNNNIFFTIDKYNNNNNNYSHSNYFGKEEKAILPPQFKTPPPSYNTLFNPPTTSMGSDVKKKTINGRQYWVVNNNGGTSLIPVRAPSALLFQYTN